MRKNYRNANGDGCITKVKNNKKNPLKSIALSAGMMTRKKL